MKLQNTLLKKSISILLVGVLLLSPVSSVVGYSYADDVPTAPSAPTAPATPQDANVAPSAPTAPSAPSGPGDVQQSQSNNQPADSGSLHKDKKDRSSKNDDTASPDTSEPKGQKAAGGGNVGDTYVQTGDANNAAVVGTQANDNAVYDMNGACTANCGGSGSVSKTGNGSGSSNNASNTSNTSNTGIQNNNANVGNNINLASDSGSNDSNGNVGDTTLLTGDANVSGTAITAVNTNVDGVAVAQFDVADDHVGDIVLDFGKSCISGCGNFNGSATNTGNGANSTNNTSNTQNADTATFQNNDALVGNDMVLSANSGANNSNMNTGGDTYIQTGDANVGANMLTFANNNVAGNVVYGVVNIYGNFQGDIVLPEDQFNTVANAGNGSGSTNNASNSTSVNDATFQNNDATIANNLVLDAATGNNETSQNTGGDSYVQTGNTSVDANVLNVANTNLSDGTVWLVLVNEAGNWIGHIMGAPDGQDYAGSAGTTFAVGANGEITASNGGNGSGSTNTASNTSNSNNTTVQNNNAAVDNTLHLNANTGGNSASQNTGGDSVIKTGDAKIIANLVNFVNNNIVGNGKLVVTVVNVFGSWVGDFVTPGQKKDATHTVSASNNNTPSQTTNSASNQDANNNSTTTTGVTNPATATQTNGQSHGVVVSTAGAGSATSVVAKANGNTAVLGQSMIAGHDKTIKAITINLAWAILLLPILLIGFTIKRRLHKALFRVK